MCKWANLFRSDSNKLIYAARFLGALGVLAVKSALALRASVIGFDSPSFT
jgi:hypothetical protein